MTPEKIQYIGNYLSADKIKKIKGKNLIEYLDKEIFDEISKIISSK